jgi:hypothetical protein
VYHAARLTPHQPLSSLPHRRENEAFISTSAFKHALFHFIFAVKPGAMAETNENPVVFFDIALGGELC